MQLFQFFFVLGFSQVPLRRKVLGSVEDQNAGKLELCVDVTCSLPPVVHNALYFASEFLESINKCRRRKGSIAVTAMSRCRIVDHVVPDD